MNSGRQTPHSVIGNARRRFNVIGLNRLVHVKQLTRRDPPRRRQPCTGGPPCHPNPRTYLPGSIELIQNRTVVISEIAFRGVGPVEIAVAGPEDGFEATNSESQRFRIGGTVYVGKGCGQLRAGAQ